MRPIEITRLLGALLLCLKLAAAFSLPALAARAVAQTPLDPSVEKGSAEMGPVEMGPVEMGGVEGFRPIKAPQTTIRVLLFETRGSVVISTNGTEYQIDAAVLPKGAGSPSRGVRANAGPVESLWRAESTGDPVRVRSPGARDLRVRGAVEVVPAAGSGLAVVNVLPLERYLQGTLGNEMYGSWSPDALKAQAVASRTYALQHMRDRRDKVWHVRSGTLSQVYAGVASESDSVREAVQATDGEILVHRGQPILAVFHSSSGGRTASAQETWGGAREYLISVEVEDEWESPDAYWRAAVSRTTLGRAIAAANRDIGPILEAQVLERTGSGRVARVRVAGDRASVTVSGRDLRSALGERVLKSTLFDVREEADGFVFVGAGNGHGVGMSQWGARAMAERGATYPEILSLFYPGAALRSILDTPLGNSLGNSLGNAVGNAVDNPLDRPVHRPQGPTVDSAGRVSARGSLR